MTEDLTLSRIVQLTTQPVTRRDLFRLAQATGCSVCGGAKHMGPCTGEGGFCCPKCGAYSGDSWGQCGGVCPMVMSPHFTTECAEEHYPGPPAEYPIDADVIDLEEHRP